MPKRWKSFLCGEACAFFRGTHRLSSGDQTRTNSPFSILVSEKQPMPWILDGPRYRRALCHLGLRISQYSRRSQVAAPFALPGDRGQRKVSSAAIETSDVEVIREPWRDKMSI